MEPTAPQSPRKVKIAYYSVNDPLDRRSWSGITYYLGQSLQRNIGEVDFLGPVKFPRWLDKVLRGMAKLTRLFFGTEYYTKYSFVQNWYSTRFLKRKMKGKDYDFIVGPASSPALAGLDTDLPIIAVHDATFHLLSNYYKEFDKASKISKWEGEKLEKRALPKSSFIVYSSHWAANSAMNHYGIAKDKILITPLGANMDYAPSKDIIFEKEKNKELTLLYLAVEWERKGGAIAFEAMKELHEKHGIKARLIVCGCVPPDSFQHSHLRVIPFLNKNKKEDHDLFVELLSTSHFLILPTRADCSLLVACESNAYGMPAIATATGGVPDVVKNDINGYCLDYEARGDKYADVIASLYTDKQRYHRLIISSRQRYEDELNWDKWAERFRDVYPKVLSAHKRSS
ncbi:MAG: glycosyltransferase family 4 protein [Bacteroidetes bacterium]|nr:glycosyltransferase family 4 protein [Bacteroidota bacterium]